MNKIKYRLILIIMNFSYLTILLLVILFFIFTKLESNNKLLMLTFSIGSILLLHEVYINIGLDRTEHFQTMIDLNDASLQVSELSNYEIYRPVSTPKLSSYKTTISNQYMSFMPLKDDKVLIYDIKHRTSNQFKFHIINTKPAFEPETTLTMPILDSKYNIAGLSFDDYIIFAGGAELDGDNISNKIHIVNNFYRTLATIPIKKGRYMMSSGQNANYICFAFGVNDSETISKQIEIYDKKKYNIENPKSWKNVSCPYAGLLNTNVVIYNDSIYFIGGFDGTSFVNSMIVYNIKDDEWNKIAMPKKFDFNLSNLDSKLILDKRDPKNDALFILSSSKDQGKYVDQTLRFSITDKPYNVPDGITYSDIPPSSITLNNPTEDNLFNYFNLGSYITDIFNNVSVSTNYTISTWLYIPKENRGKSRIILADFNLCNGDRVANLDYTSVMLHNNRLLPCNIINKKLLIKTNDEIPEVEYDKWFHYIISVKDATVSPTTAVPSTKVEAFTNSSCDYTPGSHTKDDPKSTLNQSTDNTNKVIHTYSNGIRTDTIMNYGVKFNNDTGSIVVSGFDVFDQERRYADNTKISNFKIFEGNLSYGAVIDILKVESSIYDTKTPKLVNFNLASREYENMEELVSDGKNGLIESIKNTKLVVKLDNTINIYDKNSNSFVSPVNDNNNNNTNPTTNNEIINTIETDTGCVFVYLDSNNVNFFKHSIEIPPLTECPNGTKIINDKCVECPVDTYNDRPNNDKCYPCPPNTTTDNMTGNNACLPIPTTTLSVEEANAAFKNKNIRISVDDHLDKTIRYQAETNKTIENNISENINRVKILDNNFDLLN